MYYSYIDSPLGRMFVQGDGQFVTGLFMPNHHGWRGPTPAATVRRTIYRASNR